LLASISSNTVICDTTTDGICVMPLPCENYTSFESYNFRFNFTSNVTYYMRVPLATFATNVKISGGSS